MKIIFSFAGGCLDDMILLHDPNGREVESNSVANYYRETENGEVGRRFRVPHGDGFEHYEVIRRLENLERVIVRAVHQVDCE